MPDARTSPSASAPSASASASADPASRSDLLRVAAAGVAWGTGGLAGTLLDRATGLSPLAVAADRLVVGGLLVLALLAVRRRSRPAGPSAGPRRPSSAAVRRVVAIGLLAALYQSCYFAAVALTSVSLATLVTLGTSPVLVLAADAALTRRRPGGRLLAAAGLAVAGLALLVGPGVGGSSGVLPGCLLALVSASGFAALTLLGRRSVPGLDAAATTGWAFTLGGLVLLAVAAPGGLGFAPEPGALALVLYLGLVPTAVAYVLYFRGLRTVRPGAAALLALLEPLTAALLGALVLGDRLGVAGTLGALLVGAAVVAAGRG